jgi:hypothetical protein
MINSNNDVISDADFTSVLSDLTLLWSQFLSDQGTTLDRALVMALAGVAGVENSMTQPYSSPDNLSRICAGICNVRDARCRSAFASIFRSFHPSTLTENQTPQKEPVEEPEGPIATFSRSETTVSQTQSIILIKPALFQGWSSPTYKASNGITLCFHHASSAYLFVASTACFPMRAVQDKRIDLEDLPAWTNRPKDALSFDQLSAALADMAATVADKWRSRADNMIYLDVFPPSSSSSSSAPPPLVGTKQQTISFTRPQSTIFISRAASNFVVEQTVRSNGPNGTDRELLTAWQSPNTELVLCMGANFGWNFFPANSPKSKSHDMIYFPLDAINRRIVLENVPEWINRPDPDSTFRFDRLSTALSDLVQAVRDAQKQQETGTNHFQNAKTLTK